MITPIKQAQNVNFKGNEEKKSLPFKDYSEYTKSQPLQTEVMAVQNTDAAAAEKKSISDIYHSAKLGFINVLKTFNTTTGVTGGVVSGAVKGALTTLAVGYIGKNVRQNSITGALKGMGTDAFNAAKSVLGVIPALITKAPLENAKNLFKTVPDFYTKYLKDHKGVAIVSTVAGVGMFALSVLQGKISANRANADVDHSVNTGHVPTK